MINSYTVSPASFSDLVYSKRFFLLVSAVRILVKNRTIIKATTIVFIILSCNLDYYWRTNHIKLMVNNVLFD